MKNRYWVILIIFLIVIIGLGVYFSIKNNTNNQQAEYEANKTSSNSPNNASENDTTQSNEENNEKNAEPNSNTENPNNPDNNTNQAVENSQKQPQSTPLTTTEEVELASFSTKIYSSDTARQNNIQITCNTLNNTTVKNGSTFSFCNTVGPSTTSKGYQKADIFDNNGQKKKGLGGGNCQVSTTLYNAILNVPSIKVTERHEHSNNVPYVSKGKDAAVAYGSYDFKFVNNTGNDIKINTSASAKEISVSIIALK